ncbi:hypothetical protein Lser_V15G19310 [Lactuca serriola]
MPQARTEYVLLALTHWVLRSSCFQFPISNPTRLRPTPPANQVQGHATESQPFELHQQIHHRHPFPSIGMAEVDKSTSANGIQENPHLEETQEHVDAQVTKGGENRWPGWPGESVFRILVPAQKVGSIIGRKGEFIKKMCEETGARIKILDAPPGKTTERAVMISGKEEPDASLPPAVDGLLRVHKRTVDGLDSESFPVPVPPGFIKVSTRLLVPAVQAGSLIGKQGATVKSIQEASSCIVRVLEDLPSFALQDDRIVEVVGKPGGIHKAVELIASHLRKFLVDRSVISLFEVQMQAPKPQMEQQIPPPESWGPPPHFMAPPRQIDTYYSPPEIQPHQGISAYGREAHVAMQATTTAPSVITQVTQQMQIPLSYADAVIGTAGSNISYIRRASSATISVQETKGVPGEMTVEVNGTASQVQTAQQLIQNFMADAAAPPPQPPPQIQTSTSEQGYNPYAAHATMYASPPTTSYGGQTGGYGSIYGANYGY